METNNLFVYGTLKRGFGNNYILRNSRFIGKAVSSKKFDVYDCGFPCASENPDGKLLGGEIYELSDEDFIFTDSLEANGVLYQRYIRDFKCNNVEETVKAWIYIIINPFGQLIETNYDVINWNENIIKRRYL